jgi:hypothetical protein
MYLRINRNFDIYNVRPGSTQTNLLTFKDYIPEVHVLTLRENQVLD